MKENTNRAIAINSIISYIRIIINACLGLFTTRYALQALGMMDYGLFSVLGSIISFIAVFNTIMTSTCNRFIAVAIGNGDIKVINKVFNVNLVVFLGCAIFLLIVAFPIGLWYTYNHINYDGPVENAILVFVFSLVGAVASTLATPYNGLLMAKERFFMFSFCDVAMHIIRFGVVLALVFFFEHKLLIYTILNAITVVLPAVICYMYCKAKFPDIVKWHLCRDVVCYQEVIGFSGWVSYGAIASVVRSQAATILVNSFFNTVMNTALGVANIVNHYVTLFANTITQPMQPQITKSYVAGDTKRTDNLLVMSTKYSFMVMMFIGVPFFVSAEWLLNLWLGQVPAYSVAFTQLLIIDNIVLSFNSGLSLVLFASGKIALYQLVINTLRLVAVGVAYFVLKTGVEPQALFITYIVFSLIIVFATQWCLYKTLHYDIKNLFKRSYLPSILILSLFCPLFLFIFNISPLLRIFIAISYLFILEFFIGLSQHDRSIIGRVLMQKLTRH